jgi:hypothetical protein
MENLSDLELSIVKAIVEEKKDKYPSLVSQVPFLKLKSRRFTGVGMFSHFEYSGPIQNEGINDLISSKKTLKIPGAENEVAYILAITNGKIDFLEVVTNGDDKFNSEDKNFSLE